MKSTQLNLDGRVFTVATNLNPPFITFNESNLPSGGFEMTMLNEMSKFFNFKYNLLDCNSSWGFHQSNDSWTGLIGKIASKQADFGVSAVTMTRDRSEVVHFSSPHISSDVTFITPPPKLGQPLDLVLEPFQTTVWLCLIFSLLLIVFNVWLLSQYYLRLKSLSVKWFVVSVILKQNVIKRIPKEQPLRIVLSGWLLAGLVFIYTYGSRLHSIMAFPEEIHPINTVEQLAYAQKIGKIQAVATKRSLFYNLLKNSDYGVYKVLGDFLQPIDDKNMGFSLVKGRAHKPMAFISSRDNLMYGIVRIGKNQFHIPPHNDEATVYFAHMAVPMQNDFPFINEFDSFILRLTSSGLINYWKLLEYRKIDVKFELNLPDIQPLKSLEFRQLKSVLLFSLVMLSISLVFFLYEIMFEKFFLLNLTCLFKCRKLFKV